MRKYFALPILLLSLCVSAFAAPASWYQWRSKLTGELFCAQTSPGVAWEKASGPYKDRKCKFKLPPDAS